MFVFAYLLLIVIAIVLIVVDREKGKRAREAAQQNPQPPIGSSAQLPPATASPEHSTADYQRGYSDGYAAGYFAATRNAERGNEEFPAVDMPAEIQDDLSGLTTYATAQVAQPVVAQPAPILPLTPEEVEARKQSSRKTTINVALYVASLLLSSGVLLMSQAVFFSGVLTVMFMCVITAIYYGLGLILHRSMQLLRPVSQAFVGTAIVALPICGISASNVSGASPAVVWFITSLVAVGAYGFAAVRLSSKILSYLSVISVFLFALSVPSVFQAGLLWYYVAALVVASILALLAYQKRFTLSSQFAEPVSFLGIWGVPVIIFFSIFTGMFAYEKAILYAAIFIFYCVQAIITSGKAHHTNAIAVRSISFLVAGYAAASIWPESHVAVGLAVFAAGVANVAVSLAYGHSQSALESKHNHHEVMLWVSFAAMAVAIVISVDIPLLDYATASVIGYGSPAIALFEALFAILVCSVALIYQRRSLLVAPLAVFLTLAGYYGVNAFANYDSWPRALGVVFTTFGFVAVMVRAFVWPHLTLRESNQELGRSRWITILYICSGIWLLIGAFGLFQSGDWWALGWWVTIGVILKFLMPVERRTALYHVLHGVLLMCVLHLFRALGVDWPMVIFLLAATNLIVVLFNRSYENALGEKQISDVALACGFIFSIIISVMALFIDSTWHKPAVFAVITLTVYTLSYFKRHFALAIVGNFMALVTAMTLSQTLKLPFVSGAAVVIWTGFGFFILGQIWRHLSGRRGNAFHTMMTSAAVVAGVCALMTLFSGIGDISSERLMGAYFAFAGVLATGAALMLESITAKNIFYLDTGAVLTLVALQKIISLAFPGVDPLVYSHMWFAMFAGLTFLAVRRGASREEVVIRTVATLFALSVPTLISALTGDSLKQILFLVEHAALVIVGLIRSNRLVSIWGAVCVGLAVLYMLRGYTFILTILIGLAVILAVVFVIVRSSQNGKNIG